MSTVSPAPAFKPFNLTLIQLGQIGADKAANLKHARDMIRKAANGQGAGGAQGKPDLIVLPVSALAPRQSRLLANGSPSSRRNASTRLMGTCISQSMLNPSDSERVRNIVWRVA
jgi:predicted amidohydrolase